MSKGKRKGEKKLSKDIFEAIKDKSVEEALGIYLKGNAGTPKKIALRQLLEELLDEIMKGERSVFLDADPNNKGNGY